MNANTNQPRAVFSPVTRHAIFIVAILSPIPEHLDTVRAWCGDVAAVVRSVGKRSLVGQLSCVCGFGSAVWDRLFGAPRSAQLHPFSAIGTGDRLTVSTPCDILLHIRADEMDLCFELAAQLLKKLGDAVTVVDEVHGFRYFDQRAMIGFVDGTENPEGHEAFDYTAIGQEDTPFSGGSYVLVQKYLHDMKGWNARTVETQENIIGHHKQSNIELDADVKPSYSHSSLTTLTDEQGNEVKILRDNMPFGKPGMREFGTYFIGYARSPQPIEQMLENMFIGRQAGNYDRLLDFSCAVTGSLFFTPSVPLLEALADRTTASGST